MPQRRDSFTNKVKSHGLTDTGSHATLPIVGSITRWRGDYNSLKRAFILNEPIQECVAAAVRNKRGARNEHNIDSAKLDELSLDE